MGIFNRKSAAKRDEPEEQAPSGAEQDGSAGAADEPTAGGRDDDMPTRGRRGGSSRLGSSPVGAERAERPARHAAAVQDLPRDWSTVDDAELAEMLDLGPLLVTPIPESELRLDVDDEGNTVTGVSAVVGDGALQLQVFAAPKTSGLWDEIRGEIADNLIAAGGTADESEGSLGTQLDARMPARGEGGATTYTPVRFIGVDGPRWFLRGVLTGSAAVDESVAEQLMAFARGAVVNRGDDARAPRELLGLTLPRELTQQAEDGAPGSEAMNPFERGPEITEVR